MRTLAVDGGAPAFDTEKTKVLWPAPTDAETAALQRVLDSGVWTRSRDANWSEGEAGQFEREFGAYLGCNHVTAVTNGTVAIELALSALGVEPGDEVIVPASTFFATVSPVVRMRAIPVFADIDPLTYTVSPDSIAERVTDRTVGVLVVHLSGVPVNLDAVVSVCARDSLFLVEDCAQAAGSQWRGRQVGTVGDVGTFSFHHEKQLTCGEGGAVATDDARLAGRMYAFHHGFWMPGAPEQECHEISTNARLTPFQAAILRARLPRLDDEIDRRQRNVALLRELLGPAVVPVRPPAETTRWSVYSVPLRLDHEHAEGLSRDRLVRALRAEGVSAHEGHLDPVYRRPMFRDNPIQYRNDGCPAAEHAADRTGFVISQRMFLGPDTWMYRLAELIEELVTSGRCHAEE
ncbi:DegT/DnrJ/EryC1/StrS family aminotransferase [Streptoalloteichus hindustanus]|uniref:dTDP-4-amino-4,6-dideoxygalactose transaminase n=1 Tax=Streptoalloteichus hindustanus TaxID=2017 RepID=A0A1M5CW24_STRHI|nr:DegT/DnrJ/EryC1/StrS family aminotransferase [Streptoalloteichus hindustanus]SHF58787.1 dTDP-4-amino-4,6-dideoxygalactose transaminase [Streptoalloteichus hindustanus]